MSKGSINSYEGDGEYNIDLEMVDGNTQQINAYCSDLTEDISGDVGIIEIAGNGDKGRNIQPGYAEGANPSPAIYDAVRDGQMMKVLMQRFIDSSKSNISSGVYYNWAIRPGWQKWRPNYRYGTITAIDYDLDTCSVALDACVSTDEPDGQSMDVNQSSSLSDVDIEYMDCNSAAFVVGDEIIVKFIDNDWGSPNVIGFKDNPQPCYWEPWRIALCDINNWEINAVRSGIAVWNQCPALPYGDFSSIVDGILSFSWTNPLFPPSGTSTSVLRWVDYVANPLGTVTTFKYMITVSCTDPTDSFRLRIYDTLWNYVEDEFSADDGTVERTLDVSGLGTIQYVVFRVSVTGGQTVAWDLNYVDWE